MIFIIFTLIYGLFLYIALWQLYEKAGHSGWKSLIPVYNWLILADISKVPRSILLLSFLIGFAAAIINTRESFNLMLSFATAINIYWNSNLAKAYGRGVAFTIGLTFTPWLFVPILGLGNCEYEG